MATKELQNLHTKIDTLIEQVTALTVHTKWLQRAVLAIYGLGGTIAAAVVIALVTK